MKRLLQAIGIAVLLTLPTSGAIAAQSASVEVSVTVLPSPLMVVMEPDCVFVVTAKSNKADCTTTIAVGQPTFQFEGWELMLTASGVVNAQTRIPLVEKSIKLVSYSGFLVHWGQAVDTKGGPYVPSSQFNRTLDESRSVIVADPGFGIGGYSVAVRFELKVPPKTAPGTYVPTFDITVSNTFDGKHFSSAASQK